MDKKNTKSTNKENKKNIFSKFSKKNKTSIKSDASNKVNTSNLNDIVKPLPNTQNKSNVSNNLDNKKSNDLFFEKFNKSKKDFKKESKEKKILAKKHLLNQMKISDFGKKLEDRSFFLKVYISLFFIFFITVGFSIAVFTILLPYASPGSYNSGNVEDIWRRVTYVQYPHFAITSVVFSALIFIILPSPYIYLIATWFVGINQVTRNKHFVITNISMSIFALTLFVIILILSTFIFVGVNAPNIELPAEPLPTI